MGKIICFRTDYRISVIELNLVLKKYLCSKIDIKDSTLFLKFVVQFQIGLWSAKLYF